jgi:ABC-type xylose transport system permease subunit
MTAHIKMQPIIAILLIACWAGFWFWAFSFSYSDGFFLYDRYSRIPIFITALIAAILIPVSAIVQWHRYEKSKHSGVQSFWVHTATCFAMVLVFFAVFWVLAKAPSPWRLEADDAMGAGIDLVLLVLVAILSIAVFGIALAVKRYRLKSRDVEDSE